MRRSRTIVGVVLLAVIFSVPLARAGFGPWPRGPAPPPPQGKVVVGSYENFQCNAETAFETWLGITAGSSYSIIYTPGGGYPGPNGAGIPSLAAIESALQTHQCGFGANRPQEVSVAVIDTPSQVQSGIYDSYFANLGTALNIYAPNAVVRWDWEFNIGQPWGIGNNGYTAANWAATMAYVVPKIRANAPNIKIAWTPNICPSSCNPDPVPAYPGDAYVDIIGLDAYDSFDSGNATTDWNNQWVSNTSGRALAWQISFATTHGKSVALDETGVGCALWYQNNFTCTAAYLDDSHGAAIMPYLAAWLKNTNNANGYKPYAYFDYWDMNGSYCGIVNGSVSCPGSWSTTAAPVPPSAHPSSYLLPLSAQAFYTAFQAWQ